MRTEFSGKVAGAAALLAAAASAPLSACSLFSSLAAVSGSGGQGSYAAANSVLDAWAMGLQARGSVTTCTVRVFICRAAMGLLKLGCTCVKCIGMSVAEHIVGLNMPCTACIRDKAGVYRVWSVPV